MIKIKKKNIKTQNPKKNDEEIEEISPEADDNISPVEENAETEGNSSSDSSEDEHWTYPSGRVEGVKESRKKPPLIDLEKLNQQIKKIYLNRDEELVDEFEEAKKWVGIVMEIADFRKFIWSHKEPLQDSSVLFADIYDRDRKKAIKDKVEKNVHINTKQLLIDKYYITSKGGLIAWVKTDPRLVSLIHQRAAKSSLKSFRTALFVPKLARNRKSSADRLLMTYKKENDDFRYLIRNDDRDIKVLVKRLSEGERTQYRNISLKVLGRLSPLKTQIKAKPDEIEEDDDELPDGFSTVGDNRKDGYTPKELIFKNITSLLDGFSLEFAQEKQNRML